MLEIQLLVYFKDLSEVKKNNHRNEDRMIIVAFDKIQVKNKVK